MNGEDRSGATPSDEERSTAGAPVRQPAFKIPPITLALAVAIAAAYAVLSLGPLWLADAAYKYLTVVPARVALVVVDPGRSDTVLAVLSLVSHAFIH
ncbi:MAG: hypothetical protein HKM95_05775, partial [Inquilinus sp.]|nr:hypothetical protein [Inquilinus sp.]